MSIDIIKDMISDKVAAGNFDNVIKFDCGDEGVLVINKDEVTTEDMDAECTVSMTLENLMALVKGELNPTMGFMQGKLKIDGNMGIAMKLGSLI
ncbi:MAG: SCP2 sterol-binding domain-containing protein [Gammaproteobacteria bacterium]